MKSNASKYITLVWNVGAPYYYVRIKPPLGNAHKTFNITAHGGLEKAFKAAQAWRDGFLESCGVDINESTKFKPMSKSWGAVNVVGVSAINYYRPQVNGDMYHVTGFRATWMEYDQETGKRRQKAKEFYYKQGDIEAEKRALNSATKLRKEKEGGNYYERRKT